LSHQQTGGFETASKDVMILRVHVGKDVLEHADVEKIMINKEVRSVL